MGVNVGSTISRGPFDLSPYIPGGTIVPNSVISGALILNVFVILVVLVLLATPTPSISKNIVASSLVIIVGNILRVFARNM